MIIGLLFFLFFCLPYLLFGIGILKLDSNQSFDIIDVEVLSEVLLNSLLQGAIISVTAIVGGWVLFLGVHSSGRKFKDLSFLLLLPFLMPALYTLSVYYALIPNVSYGNLSVGLIQGYVLAGYSGFNLWRTYNTRWQRLEQVSLVFGVSPLKHWVRMVPAFKSEFLETILVALLIGISSFSIPFALSGESGSNLEILLFEKIRLGQSLQELFFLSLLQLSVMALGELGKRTLHSSRRLSLMGVAPYSYEGNSSSVKIPLIWLFSGCYLLVYLAPLAHGFTKGLWSLNQVPGYFELLLLGLMNSIKLAALGFASFSALLLGVTYIFSQKSQPLVGYILFPVSAAVLAVVLWPFSGVNSLMLLIYTYSVIFIPFLFRFGLSEKMQMLQNQVLISQIYGKSTFETWRLIVLPQVIGQVFVLSAVGAFWVLLDFAVIRLFITEANYSLATIAQNWLSSYRYYEAQGLVIILGLLGLSGVGGIHYAFNRNP